MSSTKISLFLFHADKHYKVPQRSITMKQTIRFSLALFFTFLPLPQQAFGVDPDSYHEPVYKLNAKQKMGIKQLSEFDKAIVEHDHQKIQQLVKSGKFNPAKENPNEATSLFKATIVGNTQTMQLLKNLGAPIQDYSLFYCVLHGKLEQAELLLRLGADPNRIIKGISLTRLAEFDQNKPMVDLLAKYGGKMGTGVVKYKDLKK